jgi:hypothetical protein
MEYGLSSTFPDHSKWLGRDYFRVTKGTGICSFTPSGDALMTRQAKNSRVAKTIFIHLLCAPRSAAKLLSKDEARRIAADRVHSLSQ